MVLKKIQVWYDNQANDKYFASKAFDTNQVVVSDIMHFQKQINFISESQYF